MMIVFRDVVVDHEWRRLQMRMSMIALACRHISSGGGVLRVGERIDGLMWMRWHQTFDATVSIDGDLVEVTDKDVSWEKEGQMMKTMREEREKRTWRTESQL